MAHGIVDLSIDRAAWEDQRPRPPNRRPRCEVRLYEGSKELARFAWMDRLSVATFAADEVAIVIAEDSSFECKRVDISINAVTARSIAAHLLAAAEHAEELQTKHAAQRARKAERRAARKAKA